MSRKTLIHLVKIAIAIALVLLVLSQVDLDQLVGYVREMDVGLFLFGALFYFIAASSSAVRWWWLLRVNDLRVSVWQAFRFTWIGIFFNNVVPGLTGGDVVKAVYVARATGKKLRPVMSVLVDRVLGLLALALLAAVVVLFELDRPDFRWLAGVLWGGLLVLGLMVAVFLSRRIRRLIRFSKILRKLPMSGFLMQLDQAITHYRGHLPGIGLWLLFSVANHLIATVGVILIGEALHGDMPAMSYLVLVPVINILSALPIAPAGWGWGEALYKVGWSRFGAVYAPAGVLDPRQYMGTQGLTLSLIYRVHMMAWSLLGAVFLAFERSKPEEVAGLMDEIEKTESESTATT